MYQEFLSMLLALAATIAIIILVYYACKIYAKKAYKIGGGKHMKVVDRIIVSKTGSVIIIDLDGKQYMVGVTDTDIKLLSELDEAIDYSEPQELPQDNFFKAMKKVLHKGNSDESHDEHL